MELLCIGILLRPSAWKCLSMNFFERYKIGENVGFSKKSFNIVHGNQICVFILCCSWNENALY